METNNALKVHNFEQNKFFFNVVDSVIRQDMIDFNDTDFSYFFINSIIAKFIIYKEEIWIKNKVTKTIATHFPREILDDLIFKGELLDPKLSIHYKKKRIKYEFNKIEIDEILKGKESDSVWIIDNIRDSFAHGHFYIDIENKKIIINNELEDRKLKCKIDFNTFSMFEELTNLERIGGYTNRNLKTCIAFSSYSSNGIYKKFQNDYQIRDFLKNELVPIYFEVIECKESDSNKKYNDLINFYNFFSDLLDSYLINNKTNIKYNSFEKRVNEYIEKNMKNYTIKVHNNHLDNESIKKVISFINEDRDFYNHSSEIQIEIIKSIISGLIIHEDCSIERGIHNINSFFSMIISRRNSDDPYYKKLYRSWLFKFLHSFIEEQRLSNLFILGVSNFVANKESLYDNYFDDYSEFDIQNFHYKDYSRYNKLLKKMSVLNDELRVSNNALLKAKKSKQKLEKDLLYAPEDKKNIISKNKETLDTLVSNLKVRIIEIADEINTISTAINGKKCDENGNYINNDNKSFFNHLRNAFAHNRIKYADNRVVYNRKIMLEDFDDNGILTFQCECRFLDLVKLFTNKLFLEAINNKGKCRIKK